MRATDRKRSPLFSGINIEARIPAKGTEAYAVSRCRRKMIEEAFGWRSASTPCAVWWREAWILNWGIFSRWREGRRW